MRIYADTSVFGGALDEEFRDLSERFFTRVRDGAFVLVVSPVVIGELAGAPGPVCELFEDLSGCVERVDIGEASFALRQAYLEAGVVTARWMADALHVAVATVCGCRAIVSWNFKHIVNYRRIPLYNEVNRDMGYGPIAIHTPPEVAYDEEEEF